MLEVENLRYRYDGTGAAFDFNLTLETGESCILRGKSGVGKSTLLALIAGLLTPESGGLRWMGADISALAPHARPLSLLFQENNLFGHLDCAANIGLGIHPGLRLVRDEWQAVSAALAELGLGGMEKRLPATLSGGQQQRVALARVLLRARYRGSRLLLLDEPFAALDPETRKECIAVTRKLIADESLTALVVSHDAEDEKLLGARRREVMG